jgi:predicted O-methyltransferase YrrM
VLDIGTAKGFSAVVMARACLDAGRAFRITSLDVIDPDGRARRNTVAEVDGLKTLYETLEPWSKEIENVDFVHGKGENWLVLNRKRIHFAFVDGKHTYDAVRRELSGLAGVQVSGDVIVCDDLQVPGVRKAVDEFSGYGRYDVQVLPERSYAVLQRM